MTAQSSIPLKWYVPFANGDSSRVEIPVTTADPTRASQTLGFPPLTMQPPESGGVPPQGEDFNGGMNQIARVAWWMLNGGGWPYDATFATNSNINGYPNGSVLQSADFRGQWICAADNNQNNPDTNGTNWVPGFQYGTTALTSLTGGTVTPTPAQAAKNGITIAGALTSALTIILPTWIKKWTITNNTSGAFVTIVKTAAGSGITIPQNAAPTRVSGDGTNIVQAAENIAPAAQPTQAIQFGQVGSGQCRLAVASTTLLRLNPYNGNNIIVDGVPLQLPSAGITATNGGLAAATVYYVYVSGTTAAPVLELSTTGHSTIPTNGIEGKTGDATRSLVGMVRTNASSQFVNSQTQRFCINWYQRANVSAQYATTLLTFGNTTSALLGGYLVEFLTWSDEAVWVLYDGACLNNTASDAVQLVSGLDGVSNFGPPQQFNSAVANYAGNFSTSFNNFTTEGYHFSSLFGNVNGGTGSIVAGSQAKATIRG